MICSYPLSGGDLTEGRYTLLHELGTGTWGTVYEARAEDREGEIVAIKVLHPAWERHRDAAKYLLEDLARLAEVDCSGIVPTHGLVSLAGRRALVMDFIPGTDAKRILRSLRAQDEELPLKAAWEIAAAVADALASAHGAGVLHRDLKPSNILVTQAGRVVVADIGLARDDFSSAEAYTQSVRYGSVRYTAPECREGRATTKSGDVYALGAVIYELLAGRPLGNAELDRATQQHRVSAALSTHGERISGHAATLLQRMLGPDPQQRPTAAEVATAARDIAAASTGDDLCTLASTQVGRALSKRSEPELRRTFETQEVPAIDIRPAKAEPTAPPADSLRWVGVGITLIALSLAAWRILPS